MLQWWIGGVGGYINVCLRDAVSILSVQGNGMRSCPNFESPGYVKIKLPWESPFFEIFPLIIKHPFVEHNEILNQGRAIIHAQFNGKIININF